jgi:hypothetical protein
VVPYSNDAVVEALFGFAVPFSVAPVKLMLLATPVVTVGAHAVVANVASNPLVVPPTFVATTRKWYVVPQVNPAMAPPPTDTAEVPEPRLCDVVVLPYEIVVPYSNMAVVLAPFGFAVPFNVAPLKPMLLAAPVVTTGGHKVVVNVASRPFVVPPTFVATARKWYVVPQVRPVIAPPPIDTAEVPEPRLCEVVVLPYATVVPYSKNAVVEVPFGFTVAFNVAPVAVRLLATPVVAVAGHAVVAKIASRPFVVPPTFVATARKWYVVPQVRPVMAPPPSDTADVPEPRLCEVVVLP